MRNRGSTRFDACCDDPEEDDPEEDDPEEDDLDDDDPEDDELWLARVPDDRDPGARVTVVRAEDLDEYVFEVFDEYVFEALVFDERCRPDARVPFRIGAMAITTASTSGSARSTRVRDRRTARLIVEEPTTDNDERRPMATARVGTPRRAPAMLGA